MGGHGYFFLFYGIESKTHKSSDWSKGHVNVTQPPGWDPLKCLGLLVGVVCFSLRMCVDACCMKKGEYCRVTWRQRTLQVTGVTGEGRHGRERSTRLSKQWLELSLGMHAMARGLDSYNGATGGWAFVILVRTHICFNYLKCRGKGSCVWGQSGLCNEVLSQQIKAKNTKSWIKEQEVIISELESLECGHSQGWKWLAMREEKNGTSAL